MSIFSKVGNVIASDSKWTGEEPTWTGWESWPVEKFYRLRNRALNFYQYYLTINDLKPIVLAWMKTEKYSKEQIALIKELNVPVLTSIGKLIRCMNRGMPHMHPKAQDYFDTLPFHEEPPVAKSDYALVKKEIAELLNNTYQADSVESAVVEEKAKVISPMDRIRENTRKDVIMVLEELIDTWNGKTKDITIVNLLDLLKSHKVPTQGCKQIADWLSCHRVEYNDALEKTCPQAVESYSFLSKTELRKIVKAFDTMLNDVVLHSKIKVSERKPRIKKTKDATKQVAKLKYQLNSVDYSIDSVAPVRIPGSQRLYVFNTKNRQLSVFFASGNAGFEVKGSTLYGWDDAASFTTTLRKPASIITGILSSTPKKLDKIFDGLTTTRKKANGRLNENIVLLKILEHKL